MDVRMAATSYDGDLICHFNYSLVSKFHVKRSYKTTK